MIAQSLSSCHFDSPRAWFSCHSRKLLLGHIQLYPCDAVVFSSQIGCQKLASLRHSGHNCVLASGKYPRNPLIQRCSTWRTFAMSIDLEDGTSVEPQGDDSTNTDESILEDSTQTLLSEPPDSNVLKSLLVDAERSKLMKKLSEANQYNRFLKRQLQFEEDALINFKSELAILELELQTLIGLAEEIAQSGIQQDLRKINGKYIPSYLLSRLEGFHDKIKEQIEGVEAIELKEIELSWHGMAETLSRISHRSEDYHLKMFSKRKLCSLRLILVCHRALLDEKLGFLLTKLYVTNRYHQIDAYHHLMSVIFGGIFIHVNGHLN